MYAISWLCLIPGFLPWASAVPFLPSVSSTPVSHVAGLARAEPPTVTGSPEKVSLFDLEKMIVSFLAKEGRPFRGLESSSTEPAPTTSSSTIAAETAAETLHPVGEDKNLKDEEQTDSDPVGFDPTVSADENWANQAHDFRTQCLAEGSCEIVGSTAPP